MLWHTHSPLDIEAYEVIDGIVQMSSYWIEKKDMEYTILPTDRRKQAHQLVNNVRKAIEELNFLLAIIVPSAKGFLLGMITVDAYVGLTVTGISMKKKKIMNLSKIINK